MSTALTGVSATGTRGTVTPNISIALTGVSATGSTGFLVEHESPGQSFNLVVPRPTLQLTGVAGANGILALLQPRPTLALTGSVPTPGVLALTLPRPTLQMTGVTGVMGTLALTLPSPVLAFATDARLDLLLPLPVMALTGVAGAVATLALRQPRPTLTLAGDSQNLGTLALSLPRPTLAFTAQTGVTGRLALLLTRPRLDLAGVVGTSGTLALLAPRPTLALTGYYAALGTLALSLPRPTLAMVGITTATAAQVAASRTTYALQTARMALTTYTGFPFNSFATFAGRQLGASSTGIFDLVGDTDAGTAIDAVAHFGITDMNTSAVKVVDRVYVGYRATGRMVLVAITDESQTREYAIPAPAQATLHGGHVRLGKGVKARYWQFGVRNDAGADFTLDTAEVKPTRLPPRVGAKDA